MQIVILFEIICKSSSKKKNLKKFQNKIINKKKQ
jgi:CRISPR/Cas system-associated protein endoribonuclease Cas2